MPLDISGAAVLAIAASASLAVAAAWRRDRWRIYVFKPLTTALIIAATLWCFAPALGHYRNIILLGLALSLAGDVFLMLPGNKFIPGLASFLAAHLAYIWAFTLGVGFVPAQLVWLAPFAFFGLVVVAYLWRGLPDAALKGAVVAYVLVIVVMAWRAAVRAQSPALPYASAVTALAGACLFLASDSVLAVDRFRRPFRAAQPVVFATYWAAQLLIALSVRA
jgi:uncharacterized membrane protein YhhN